LEFFAGCLVPNIVNGKLYANDKVIAWKEKFLVQCNEGYALFDRGHSASFECTNIYRTISCCKS